MPTYYPVTDNKTGKTYNMPWGQPTPPTRLDAQDFIHRQENPGWWEWGNTPLTDAPGRFMKNYVAEPLYQMGEVGIGPSWMRRGFMGAGAGAELLGDIGSGMTSPIGLGLTALTFGTGAAARAGLTGVSQGLVRAQQAGGAGMMGHGAYQAATADKTRDKFAGVAEGLGGYLGLKYPYRGPTPKAPGTGIGPANPVAPPPPPGGPPGGMRFGKGQILQPGPGFVDAEFRVVGEGKLPPSPPTGGLPAITDRGLPPVGGTFPERTFYGGQYGTAIGDIEAPNIPPRTFVGGQGIPPERAPVRNWADAQARIRDIGPGLSAIEGPPVSTPLAPVRDILPQTNPYGNIFMRRELPPVSPVGPRSFSGGQIPPIEGAPGPVPRGVVPPIEPVQPVAPPRNVPPKVEPKFSVERPYAKTKDADVEFLASTGDKAAVTEARQRPSLWARIKDKFPLVGEEGGFAGKKPARPDGVRITRAKDFNETHNYDVELPNGKKVQIFRDTDQFGTGVWHLNGEQDFTKSFLGYTREDAIHNILRNKRFNVPEPVRPATPTGQGMTAPSHPIVERMRKGLPTAQNLGSTRFVLPDGHRLSHTSWQHSEATGNLGLGLQETLESGVMRFTQGGSGEVYARMTRPQAEALVDASVTPGGRNNFYVDVHVPGGADQYLFFDEKASVDAVLNKVNRFFDAAEPNPSLTSKNALISSWDDEYKSKLSDAHERVINRIDSGETLEQAVEAVADDYGGPEFKADLIRYARNEAPSRPLNLLKDESGFVGRRPPPKAPTSPKTPLLSSDKAEGFFRKFLRDEEGVPGPLADERASDLKRMYDDFATSGLTTIKNLGGEDLAILLQKSRLDEEQFAGTINARLKQITSGLSPDELRNYIQARDVDAPPMNQKVADALEKYHDVDDMVMDLVDKLGLGMRVGKKMVPFERMANHFAHIYPPEFFKNKQSALKTIMEEGVTDSKGNWRPYTMKEAQTILNKATEYNERLIDPQHGRIVNAPGYRTDINVDYQHYDDMAKRIIQARNFGKMDTASPDSPISLMIEQTDDPIRVEKIIDKYLGRIEPMEPAWARGNEFLIDLQTKTKLSKFILNNLAQLHMIPARAGLANTGKALAETVFSPTVSMTKAEITGALQPVLQELVKDIGGPHGAAKYFGIAGAERFIRTVAAIAGKHKATELFQQIKKNPTNKRLRLQVEDLFLEKADDVIRMKSLPRTLQNRVGARMAEVTQGRASSIDLPPKWTDVPEARLYLLFKRYAFQQSRNLKRAMETVGPVKASAYILGSSLMLGEAIGDANAVLKGTGVAIGSGEFDFKDAIEKAVKERGQSYERILNNIAQAWTLGYIGDLYEAAGYGKSGLASSAVGPVLGDIFDVAPNLLKVGHGAIKTGSGAVGMLPRNKQREGMRDMASGGRGLAAFGARAVPFIGTGLAAAIRAQGQSGGGRSRPR